MKHNKEQKIENKIVESKNVKNDNKNQITLSLIEEAKKEKEQKRKGIPKPKTKELFKLWLALPDTFKGLDKRVLEILGIIDDVTLEMLAIRTATQFASEFGVEGCTLTGWKKEIEDNSEFFLDVKRQFKKFTKNVVAATYRKALEEGDAQRLKIWMQIIEDWREQLGIEGNVKTTHTLTDEEKLAIAEVMKKL